MGVSEYFTQQKLQKILMNTYAKGAETENIQLKDIIEDIKKQVLEENK